MRAVAERRSKKPRIRFVPSKVLITTNLGRGLASSLYAPDSPAHEEFRKLAKAVDKLLRR